MVNQKKKGVELTKSGPSSGISITIGNTVLKPEGHPVIVSFERQEKPTAHVYLVIDTSGSMAGGKLEQAKKGILDFAEDAFRKEFAVGLISFNTTASHMCEPTYEIELLEHQIQKMHATGSTNMAAAIKLAHDHLKRTRDTKVIVIATDGMPDKAQDALKEGASAKKDKIDIIIIGTDDANQEFLKKLATTAELGKKVTREAFSQAISSASNLLPPPKYMTKR